MSLNENWSIPTECLISPRKKGGSISLKGFNFQEAYASLHLVYLLNPQKQLKAVRYEGAQDLDLLCSDGQEKYVQLKNEPGATYTLKKVIPILQSFANDLLEAAQKDSLRFELVARSNHIDAAVARLCRNEPTEPDLHEIARALALSISTSRSTQLRTLGTIGWGKLAKQLLGQTTLRFGMGDEVGGRLSFQSHACAELARHGVSSADLQSAFEALQSALEPQRTYTRADVLEILKRFVGGAALDIFGGRVEALTDDLLSRPASPEEVQFFYEGERPLDWNIIAAGGDIARDQKDDLVTQLTLPSETLRLVCLVAEPGAGKSTLARRVAAELHSHHQALVIRIKHKEDAEPWYLMPDFSRKVARPYYILADDLFRVPEVVAALHELDNSLPITILGTSRENEYRPGSLTSIVTPFRLSRPSTNEKTRILDSLGKSRDELTPAQQARLDAANQFLALMMEVTGGKELREIVSDTVKRLRSRDEFAYRAYEYICFCYRHSILIPESLLERLDASGRFHALPQRKETQGIIFYDEGRTAHLKAGHPILAETAWAFYHRASAAVLRDIANAVDSSNPQERLFFGHLFSVMARANPVEVVGALPQIDAVIEECLQHAKISELGSWRNCYRFLGRTELAESCTEIALSLIPADSQDCNVLLGMFRERGLEGDALPAIAEAVRRNSNSHIDRSCLLGLVERYGTTEAQKAVIDETDIWLGAHEDDSCVRAVYLGLVERKGTTEQVAQVLQETSKWLSQHDNDNYVRTAYVGLVQRKATTEQVAQVLQETSKWLSQHDNDHHVRMAYVGLVERKGTTEQVAQVLQETSKWLAEHDNDSSARTTYLGLVERKGTTEQVAQVLQETSKWLSQHDNDHHVRMAYVGLVERKGTTEQVAQVLQETSKWLAEHDNDSTVRTTYLGLVERKGATEQAAQVLQETSKWLAEHDNDSTVRTTYLGLVERKGTTKQAAQVLQETNKWLAEHDDSSVRTAYLGLVERKGTTGQVAQVLQEISKWLAEHDNDSSVRTAYLGLVERKGTTEQVAQVLQETSKWLAEHDNDSTVRTTYLGLVERKGATEQAAQVLQETSKWLAEHDNDSTVRTTYLGLVERKGTTEQAECALNETKEWLQRHRDAHYVWEALIASLVRLGRIDESADLVQQVVSRNVSQRNLVSHYIRFLKNENDEQKVRYAYARLMNNFPRDEDIPRYFADWLREHNQLADARAIYKRLLDKQPDDYRLHYAFGRLLLKELQLPEAIAEFQNVIRRRQDHQLAHDNLAYALRLLGESAEQRGQQEYADRLLLHAEREYRLAIRFARKKDRPQGRFYANIGWFYIARARHLEALLAFESSLRESPDYWEYHWGVGSVLFSLGQFQSAADALQKASESSPEKLQPPASEEIPRLHEQCLEALRKISG